MGWAKVFVGLLCQDSGRVIVTSLVEKGYTVRGDMGKEHAMFAGPEVGEATTLLALVVEKTKFDAGALFGELIDISKCQSITTLCLVVMDLKAPMYLSCNGNLMRPEASHPYRSKPEGEA